MAVNVAYMKTLPGLVKLVQLVLAVLCMALSSPVNFSGVSLFEISIKNSIIQPGKLMHEGGTDATNFLFGVSILAFVFTLIFILSNVVGLREKLKINWDLCELICLGIVSLLFVISSFVLASWGTNICATENSTITCTILVQYAGASLHTYSIAAVVFAVLSLVVHVIGIILLLQ